MDIVLYLTSLKEKYNYDDKLILALSKIIPTMIKYYGEEYKDLILEAINKTEIITCNELQTISIIIEEKNLIEEDNSTSIIKNDNTLVGGKYLSEPTIVFDKVLNTYVIPKINRYIILSHTYNLDSAAGLAALTKEMIILIKCFKNEYKLNNDKLIHRCGIKEEIKEIVNLGEKLKLLEEQNAGICEVLNIYDEEEIVSNILNDKYTSRNYPLSKSIGKVIMEKLNLKESIISEQLNKTKAFEVDLNKEDNMFEKLTKYTDQVIEFENKCDLTIYTKDEMQNAKTQINILNSDIATICANYIINSSLQNTNNYN